MIKHPRIRRSGIVILMAGLLAGCAVTGPGQSVSGQGPSVVAGGADEAPFWYRLGNHRVGKGDLEGAVAAYRQALVADPDDYRARHNLGLVYARLSEHALRKSAARDPGGPDPAPVLQALFEPWLGAEQAAHGHEPDGADDAPR